VIPSLLIVDDEAAARRLAGRILRNRYRPALPEEEAIEIALAMLPVG
jgi:hypothetical protein